MVGPAALQLEAPALGSVRLSRFRVKGPTPRTTENGVLTDLDPLGAEKLEVTEDIDLSGNAFSQHAIGETVPFETRMLRI